MTAALQARHNVKLPRISRFVDGTDLPRIEPDAHEVEPELGLVVRCLPTEHAA